MYTASNIKGYTKIILYKQYLNTSNIFVADSFFFFLLICIYLIFYNYCILLRNKKIIKSVFKNKTTHFHINAPGIVQDLRLVTQKGTVGSYCCILGIFLLFGESWQLLSVKQGRRRRAGIFLVELIT